MNNSRSCDCANGCYYVDNFFIAVISRYLRHSFDKLAVIPHCFDFPHEIIKIFTIFQKRSCQNIKVVLYLKLPNKTLQFNIGDFLLSYGYIVLFLYSFILVVLLNWEKVKMQIPTSSDAQCFL